MTLTTPLRVLTDDIAPVRLVAELRRVQPADIVHEALREYFANHKDDLAKLHAQTHAFIAAGDVEGLAAAMKVGDPAAERAARNRSR